MKNLSIMSYVALVGMWFMVTPFGVFCAHDIGLFHSKIVSAYGDLTKNGSISDPEKLQPLFVMAYEATLGQDGQPTSKKSYIARLSRDITTLKRVIKQKRKHKESVEEETELCGKLTQLLGFLKKHRLQVDVVGYHAAIKTEWKPLIECVDQGKDILTVLPAHGFTQPPVKALKALINKMEQALRKISIYEDRLHADWVDLKLSNYVLKIQLIRVRNSAIFHPLYRGLSMQTNYPK